MRVSMSVVVTVAVAAAAFTLVQAPAEAGPSGECLSNPIPPDPVICRACPTYVDPVVCTVICKGGPQQQTFTNQCFATCSGLKFKGACQPTGG
jgi:hypothetical protein